MESRESGQVTVNESRLDHTGDVVRPGEILGDDLELVVWDEIEEGEKGKKGGVLISIYTSLYSRLTRVSRHQSAQNPGRARPPSGNGLFNIMYVTRTTMRRWGRSPKETPFWPPSGAGVCRL